MIWPFNRKAATPDVGLQPAPAILNPTHTERVLRVKARIQRLEAFLPSVPKNKQAPYVEELTRLKATLVASGIKD